MEVNGEAAARWVMCRVWHRAHNSLNSRCECVKGAVEWKSGNYEAKWALVYLGRGVNGACRGVCVCATVAQSHMGRRFSVGAATERTSWFTPPDRKSHGRVVMALPRQRPVDPLRSPEHGMAARCAQFLFTPSLKLWLFAFLQQCCRLMMKTTWWRCRWKVHLVHRSGRLTPQTTSQLVRRPARSALSLILSPRLFDT